MRKARMAVVLSAIFLAAGNAWAADDVMVVFDGSNSMWGQIDGTAKIEIAREAMQNLMGDWTSDANLGLMAYGHRREGDCTDIETIIPPGHIDREDFLARVHGITPRGKTPLTAAVEQAAQELAYRDNPATVVLISDGIESCQRDPCALADELERSGIDFTAHVIGFGLESSEEQASIACIAERTGGRFIAAGNARELGNALGTVSEAVASAPVPEPGPASQPAPPEERIELIAPEIVTEGTRFEVSWGETLDQRDIVTIVTAGAVEDEIGEHLRTGEDSSGTLRAPAETGLYEVRYVRDEGRTVAGQRAIEVTKAETRVTAPETAVTGSSFEVSWTQSMDASDIVTIVPAGAEDGTVEEHLRVREKSSGQLRAPAQPGLYEVRYVLDQGRKTVAAAGIEVMQAETAVTAPGTATAGSDFKVGWTRAIHPGDIVTIVSAGAEDGAVGDHVRVRDKMGDALRAPGEPGLYEVRYVLDKGRRTIASSPIEITPAETTVVSPASVLAGASFDVSWSTSINPGDIVTIVQAGADHGTVKEHIRVRDKSADTMRAPGRPGLYEVRYVLDAGRRTLDSAQIEVTEPKVEITATSPVRAGGEIEVGWTGEAPSRSDIITIVPLGSGEGEVQQHQRVRDKDAMTVRAPEQPGMYEVRYVLDRGRRTLASAPVEVLDEMAALDAGGSLDVPETAAPGEEVRVSWTSSSTSSRQRVSLAERSQPDFTWIEAKSAGNEPPLSFTMPDEPGVYEFRLIDLAGPKVLSRAIIEVR